MFSYVYVLEGKVTVRTFYLDYGNLLIANLFIKIKPIEVGKAKQV